MTNGRARCSRALASFNCVIAFLSLVILNATTARRRRCCHHSSAHRKFHLYSTSWSKSGARLETVTLSGAAWDAPVAFFSSAATE